MNVAGIDDRKVLRFRYRQAMSENGRTGLIEIVLQKQVYLPSITIPIRNEPIRAFLTRALLRNNQHAPIQLLVQHLASMKLLVCSRVTRIPVLSRETMKILMLDDASCVLRGIEYKSAVQSTKFRTKAWTEHLCRGQTENVLTSWNETSKVKFMWHPVTDVNSSWVCNKEWLLATGSMSIVPECIYQGMDTDFVEKNLTMAYISYTGGV